MAQCKRRMPLRNPENGSSPEGTNQRSPARQRWVEIVVLRTTQYRSIMAVFISASDEYSGSDGSGSFLFAGYIGPEKDWSDFFVPAWRQRVLDGPPTIPYLHMTEI